MGGGRGPLCVAMSNRPHRRRVLLQVGGCLLGAALLVAFAIVSSPQRTPRAVSREPLALVPAPLPPDALGAAGAADPEAMLPNLEAGGWIQAFDQPTGSQPGRLLQQYRFVRLDPNPAGVPPGFVRMDDPKAEFYLSDHRVVTLSGKSALAYMPHRVLESGTITGTALIKVFEPPRGLLLDEARDKPLLVIHTAQATFDNILGEVRCPERVRIESLSMEMVGETLSILINDHGPKLRMTLEVERLDHLRIARSAPETRPTGTAAAPAPAVTAPSPAPAPPSASPAAPPADADPQIYRLTLHEHVRIQEGIGARIATGDELVLLFSPESRDLLPRVAAGGDRSSFAGARRAGGWGLEAKLDLSPILFLGAGTPPSIAPNLRADDIYVTCTGSLTMVPVSDPADAAALSSPQDARMTLTGQPVELLDREAPARVTCGKLVYRALDERIELDGSPEHPLLVRTPKAHVASQGFWMRGEQAGFTGRGSLTGWRGDDAALDAYFGGPPGSAAPEQALHATWTEGLDLDLGEAGPSGEIELRAATFRGDVVARAETGELTAGRVRVGMERDPGGVTRPSEVEASGNVSASDRRFVLWSDSLRATFQTLEAEATGPGAAQAGEYQLDHAIAEGDAQVLLPGGARAFGERLTASGGGRHVELTGSDVALASRQMLIEHGHRVLVDKQDRSVEWEGPGQARLYLEPPALENAGRIARSALDRPARATVSWRGSMTYDEGSATARAIGGVSAVEEHSPLERTTVDAPEMVVHLVEGQSPSGAETGDAHRAVQRIEAIGGAKLEQRSWLRPDRGDEPRIFYLASERLEYDEQTGNALVPGPGEMLIQDPRPPERATLLGSRGTTSFRWVTRLTMTRREGSLDEYDILMLDGIEMRHRATDGGAVTLACNRVEAFVDLSRGAAAAPASPPAGGQALRRLRARDEVFLRTPERDIECGMLDYDAAARVMDLLAAPGGAVTVTTRATAQQVRFERAGWDLATDTVRAVSVSGGG